VSALDRELKLPELVGSFGLVLFVYTIGVAGGPGFFASLRRRGLAENALALGLISIALALARLAALARSTSTASLAAGHLRRRAHQHPRARLGRDPGIERWRRRRRGDAREDPVVAYSLTYPFGVIGVLFAIWVMRRKVSRKDQHGPSRCAASKTRPRHTSSTRRCGSRALRGHDRARARRSATSTAGARSSAA
jgi:putative transport protein